ncbi:Sco1-like protein [Thermoproteus uzoniensis 768-20]|uniref:Sco1-like protein n=1 Tax=Thermoproteus uzoniensis (strain 768-20) TaxID=999630 RepID=F2L077_THEU7|nr:SCO family protein [Thermoproteus uzoniensis]AEA12559.1 Sco1-like protein [Thermoproteus uzoniensis 768-20]
MRMATILLVLLPVASLAVYYLAFRGTAGQSPADSLGLPQAVYTCYPPGKRPQAYDFNLTDQYGERIALDQLWNRPVLLTFTYTYCPDVCPLVNSLLNRTLPLLGGGVVAVDVTLDPQHDTVQRLAAYSKANHYDWLFLTGPESYLEGIWKAYGVTRIAQQNYIAHSIVFVVIYRGEVLGRVDGMPTSPEQLASFVKTALAGCG